MTHDPFGGTFPAMTTPFRDDAELSIDFETLGDHARRLVEGGVDGLVPVGTTGESATMTHDEHIEVVAATVDAVADYDVPVIAGAGSNNTRESRRLARRAADAGADGLLLISPYYNIPEPEGMEAHFRAVADTVDLPQIIYNVPGRTGRNIDVETAVSLASHENIVGYKAASGDMNRICEVIERTAADSFGVFSGDDALTLPVVATGGVGTISVAANVEPRRTSEMVEAARADEMDRARRRHRELGPLFRELFVRTNPLPVNEACGIRGYHDARMRAPLSRLSDTEREALRRVLEALEPLPEAGA